MFRLMLMKLLLPRQWMFLLLQELGSPAVEHVYVLQLLLVGAAAAVVVVLLAVVLFDTRLAGAKTVHILPARAVDVPMVV